MKAAGRWAKAAEAAFRHTPYWSLCLLPSAPKMIAGPGAWCSTFAALALTRPSSWTVASAYLHQRGIALSPFGLRRLPGGTAPAPALPALPWVDGTRCVFASIVLIEGHPPC